nr:hypothetical protein [Antarcticimicrobium luteum]
MFIDAEEIADAAKGLQGRLCGATEIAVELRTVDAGPAADLGD